MSMFDYFQPASEQLCPVCGRRLQEWQGKDGPCGLFVWKEGVFAPVDQLVSEDVRLEAGDLERQRLPRRFMIYSYDCPEHRPIEADCEAPDGLWSSTVLRPKAGIK